MDGVLTRIAHHPETSRIGRALLALFLIAGFLGTFASTADAASGQSAPSIVHCLSVADNADPSDTGTCCTLGCPMVSTALPAPAPSGVAPDHLAVDEPPTATGEIALPSALPSGGDSARGPPA